MVLAAGILWLTAGWHVKSPLFPQPPLKQQCAPRWDKAWDRRLFTIQRSPRISTSWIFTAPRYRLPCRLFRWASNLAFQQHWKIAQSCRSHKHEVSAISATTFATALSLYIAHDGRKPKHNPTLSANNTSYKFAAPRYRLPPMALQTVQVSVEPPQRFTHPLWNVFKKTAVAYGADLLAFELNGEVVSGLPGHHSSENLVLSWARRAVGDDCLEIHVLLMFF